MKHRLFILELLLIMLLAACGQGDSLENAAEPKNDSTSPFVFEEDSFDFGVIKQSDGIVSHDFTFTYTGDATINITSTPGSCLCTSAVISKTELNSGDTGILTVEFNPNLHAEPEGRFFKSVAILTDPALNPVPEVKVWQEIDLDLGKEFFELQADHKDGK